MTNYPEVDVKRFFDAVLEQALAARNDKTRQEYVSIQQAAGPAFVALKKAGNWPYGPRSISGFTNQFNEEQRGKLRETLKTEILPSSKPKPITQTDKFAEDDDLRIRFLTDVVNGDSRARLAFKYQLPLELVAMALTQAILREAHEKHGGFVRATTVNGSASFRGGRNLLIRTAIRKPQWQSLTDLKTRVDLIVYRDKWPSVPSQDERDELTALQNDRRVEEERAHPSDTAIPSSLSGEVLPDEMVPDAHGDGLHAAQWTRRQGGGVHSRSLREIKQNNKLTGR